LLIVGQSKDKFLLNHFSPPSFTGLLHLFNGSLPIPSP
jgi:hypothetical protein